MNEQNEAGHTALGDEIDRLRAINAELLAALQTINDGNTMQGTVEFTHADVIQRHYQIARAALSGAKGLI